MNINVNIEELIRLSNKLSAYKNNETSSFSKILDLFNRILLEYNGPLNSDIKSINDLIYRNFKTIGLNHEKDLNYISANITNYKQAVAFTNTKFEQVGDLR